MNNFFYMKLYIFLFADASECPPNNSPGHSYCEESGFPTYRGSEEDVREPSSPSGEYSSHHSSKPIAPRFQKQPQHQQQQVNAV